MKIVIDISDDNYKTICEKLDDFLAASRRWGIEAIKNGAKAIKNGTPLPKGHGRLIDADWTKNRYKPGNWDLHKVLKAAPTIIEADKEDK